MQKKFWESSNFYTMLFLAIGGLWMGFDETLARETVTGGFALLASFKSFREFFKSGIRIPFSEWIGKANVRGYLSALIVAVVPKIPSEVLDSVWDLLDSILLGNFQAILFAAFGLITILYKIFFDKPRA